LTIAGFDPSSGAGITADLAVIAAHGFFGTSAITAMTVQSTVGVRKSHAVKPGLIRESLRYLAQDITPSGVKIGMLATGGNVEVVAEFLHQQRTTGATVPVVLDPVIRSSSGRELLGRGGIDAVLTKLMPMVDWITPNALELAVLTKMPTSTPIEIEAASRLLIERFPSLNVVATGGDGEQANDLATLCDGRQEWFRGKKIESRGTHGTGCAFSTALTCRLVAGTAPLEAVNLAKEFVVEAIQNAPGIGRGNGPMELLWPLRRGRRTGD
jgi:hydroxymethylpyrimidine/phosphomethylpyrimidine kinase